MLIVLLSSKFMGGCHRNREVSRKSLDRLKRRNLAVSRVGRVKRRVCGAQGVDGGLERNSEARGHGWGASGWLGAG